MGNFRRDHMVTGNLPGATIKKQM